MYEWHLRPKENTLLLANGSTEPALLNLHQQVGLLIRLQSVQSIW
jgi:hypothetical protein